MTAKGFDETLQRLRAHTDVATFREGLKGVEKESLRTTGDGALAQTAHPSALGSALTHAHITTDFSEALLEFVTPASSDYWQTHQFLCDLHQYTYAKMGDELLWVNSMPCRVAGDAAIPLADYGASNVGTMKTVYRRGLGYRYGRAMQTIAGMHFNYSLPTGLWPVLADVFGGGGDVDQFRSSGYLGLLRNHRRYGWLLLYLTGASPAMCKSFIDAGNRVLPEFDDDTVFEPYATSLRMSDLGYSNKTQARLNISLNCLDEYIEGLCRAISTPEPAYEDIGVVVDGRYRQLSANVLQIENEYYSPMRPKRVAHSGERPTHALGRGGIEYIELRSLDLNPFEPVGINQRQARFVELFLLYCLIEDSPRLDAESMACTQKNHQLTASLGRDPGLTLRDQGKDRLLADWADELMDKLAALAETLDAGGEPWFAPVVAEQRRLVADATLTPSAELLRALADGDQSFIEFGLERARANRDYFQQLEFGNAARFDALATEAQDSLARQREIEASDEITFSQYLAEYFATPCD